MRRGLGPYVIGMFPAGDNDRSHALYYAEGFCVPPTWTYRDSANQYTNKRQAIREARTLASAGRVVYVEPYRNPFPRVSPVQPVWVSSTQ